MLKKIINLIVNRASVKRWQIEIGTHLLKKGCGYQIGQIIQEKKLRDNLYRVKVITGIFYDFKKNEITHTSDNRVIKGNEKKG